MRRVICNQCKKESAPDAYGLAPSGWIQRRVMGVFGEKGEADLCSPECEIALVREQALANAPATTEPTPPAAPDLTPATV